MTHTLPALPYAYDALEPHIDTLTMTIHHTKHHQAYVDNLNKAIAGTEAENMDIISLMGAISKFPATVRNNGGGHYNHTQFWMALQPNASGTPVGALADAINSTFGSVDAMKEQMNAAGATRFGSGWVWLGVKDGQLAICSTPNQDNPLMDLADCKCHPIFGIDVWEHAYYLHYQNRRADYLAAIWNLVNWEELNNRFVACK